MVNISMEFANTPGAVTTAVNDKDALTATLNGVSVSTLLVAGAGNKGSRTTGAIADYNRLATSLHEFARNALVVAGSGSGGISSTDDEQTYNTLDGVEVDLAAPSSRNWVLKDADDSTHPPIYSFTSGTSFSAPQVTSAAALVMAIGANPSGSTSAITAADAARVILDRSIDISSRWGSPRVRLDLFGAVLDTLEWSDSLDKEVRVYATEYSTGKLYAQVVDPVTGAFQGTSVETRSVTTDGCTKPTAVETDPRGDIVYVLCEGNPGSIYAYTAVGLDLVGHVILTGNTGSTSDIVVTMDGVLIGASVSGSTAIADLWDTFDGGKLGSETIVSSDVASVEGAADLTYGKYVAFSTYDNSATDADGEQVAVLTMDVYNRDSTTPPLSSVVQDHGGINVGHIRYVDWNTTDSTLNNVFYTNTAGNEEISEVSTSGTLVDYGELNDVVGVVDTNLLYSIATNPSGADSFAYIGEWASATFAMTDMDQAGNHDAIAFYEYDPAGSVTFSPRNVAFAQNGKFVAFGFAQSGTSGQVTVWTVPHDNSATGTVDVTTVGDAMSKTFIKTRGVAITPVVSLLSPRPGKALSGKHRIYLLVRDPNIVSLTYKMNGSSTFCPSTTSLNDGIADTCAMDTTTTAWSSATEHILEVVATYSDATTFSTFARY